ncbi:MAG: DEAD/DEAH box helicase [Deltaproteobacteria bacterium]|nr:DEAD/DEAH box helicase [Deltaproteobacteria bacterium]
MRPYQREAIEAILRRRRAGVRRAVVSLPTGAGKTVIFSHLAQLAQRRVLVLAHREELLAQAKDKLERALAGRARVEIEQAGRRASAEAKVVVASLRSLRPERLARLLDEEGFGLVIYDECHHAVADDNKRVLAQLGVFDEGFSGTLVGFTATTARADGVGLEEVFEEVVYSRSLLDMIRDGYLVPVRGLRVSTAVSLEGVGGAGDFGVEELEERVDIEERNGLVARSVQELARDRRTICFCVTVRHAERLAEALRDLGVPAAAVHGELRAAERAALLRDFREGALQVITNVGVLTEGFDDPGVSCVAMARPTRSEGLYVQCVGRGMRLAEGKRDCLVLDFVDLSALRLVTLPTLVGVPVEVDFEGREAGEAAAAYWRLVDEHPGFEWEAAAITLTELQERARAFDPLRLRLSPEVRAISQNGWVSLGQRGLALSFSRDGESFSELLVLQTSEGGKRRYQLTLDGREVGRAARVEEAVEASDFEVGRMGHLAVETASCYAPWRAEPAPPELARELGRQLPYPPRTLEDVFRAMLYLRQWSTGRR